MVLTLALGSLTPVLSAVLCVAQPADDVRKVERPEETDADDPACGPKCRKLRARVATSCERGDLHDALDAMTRLVEAWPERFRNLYSDICAGAAIGTNPNEALHTYERLRHEAWKRNDRRGEACLLLQLGRSADAAGHARDAERYLSETQRAAADIDDHRLEATALAEHGLLLSDQDRYDDAVDLYGQSASKYREAGDQSGAAEMQIRIGEVYGSVGDLEEEEKWYRKALTEGEQAGDKSIQLRALVMLAAVAVDQEREDVVKERLDDAFKMLSRSLVDFARDTSQARATLTPDGIVAMEMLGEACAWSDCRQLAVPLLKFALAVHRKAPRLRELRGEISDDLYYLGMAYAQTGHLKGAWQALKQAQHADRRLGRPEDYWLLNQMGAVREKEGRLGEALQYYRQATEMLESTTRRQRISRGKFSSRESTFSFYQDVVRVLTEVHAQTGDENQLREAFRYFERGKAQTLLDLLAKGGKGKSDNKVEKAHAEMDARRPVRATVSDVRAVLADGTLLVEYALGEKRSTLWAITRSGVRTVTALADEETITKLVRHYLELCKKGPLAEVQLEEYARVGADLYSLLLEPIRAELARTKRLVIVPDGILHHLPFEALPIEQGALGKDVLAGGAVRTYLGALFATSYVPSSSVLSALKRRDSRTSRLEQHAAQSPILMFGSPIFSFGGRSKTSTKSACRKVASTVSALPWSTKEIEQIAAIYGLPLDSGAVNLAAKASAKRLREVDLARYRILHFATHAIAEDQVVGLSQPLLLLSPSEDDDGCLSRSEIFGLHLNSELVVLSACDTAVGPMYRGEGVVGLTSAFLYAGSRSVIASLWRVNDQSTGLFMEAFYGHLKGGQPPTEALRLARTEIMQRRMQSEALGTEQSLAAPYYWAPFVLVGSPD